jgi:hypothetical protein
MVPDVETQPPGDTVTSGRFLRGRALHQRLVIFALVALGVVGVAKGRHARDYRVYVVAGDRFVQGAEIYRDADLPMPFKYPPPGAALFAPLSRLPYAWGGVLWNLFGVVCFVFALFKLRTTSIEAAVVLITLSQSVPLVLHHGQVDLVILGLAVVAWYEPRPILAGAALAVACILKSPVGLLALGWLMQRRFRALAWCFATVVVSTIPVFLRYGVVAGLGLWWRWRELLATSTASWFLRHDAQGWPSAALGWIYRAAGQPANTPNPPGMAMLLAQIGAIAVFALLLARRQPKADDLGAAVMLGVALLSPQAWRANFVMAAPAIVVVARRLTWKPSLSTRRWRLLAMAVLALLAATQLIFAEAMMPHAILDPALANVRPFAVAYSLLLATLLTAPGYNGNLMATYEDGQSASGG